MNKLFKKLWNTEPVYILTALTTIFPVGLSGLEVFNVWTATPDQYQWLTSIPAVLGIIIGVRVKRTVWTPDSVREEVRRFRR